MGSRCEVYLFADPSKKCYAISRNGYPIKRVNMDLIFQTLRSNLEGFLQKEDIELLILDGELLPWCALGEELIEREFTSIALALEKELAFLDKTGYEQAHAAYLNESGKKKEKVSLKEQQDALSVYKEQLRLYGSKGELEFKPFTILKYVKKDGTEVIPESQIESFCVISKDAHLVIDLGDTSKSLQEHCRVAREFFDKQTQDEKQEGIVIKPDVFDGTVPWMKVRNPLYMGLIFGYDYRINHEKYRRLLEKKNIKKKLALSIQEMKLGREMLRVPYNQIEPSNEHFTTLLKRFIVEENQESTVDPRL